MDMAYNPIYTVDAYTDSVVAIGDVGGVGVSLYAVGNGVGGYAAAGALDAAAG